MSGGCFVGSNGLQPSILCLVIFPARLDRRKKYRLFLALINERLVGLELGLDVGKGIGSPLRDSGLILGGGGQNGRTLQLTEVCQQFGQVRQDTPLGTVFRPRSDATLSNFAA